MSKELDEKQKILDSLLESKSKIQEQQQENIKILDTHPSIDNAYLLFQQGKVSEADFLSYKDTREAIETQVNGFPQVMQVLDTQIEQIRAEIKDLKQQEQKEQRENLGSINDQNLNTNLGMITCVTPVAFLLMYLLDGYFNPIEEPLTSIGHFLMYLFITFSLLVIGLAVAIIDTSGKEHTSEFPLWNRALRFIVLLTVLSTIAYNCGNHEKPLAEYCEICGDPVPSRCGEYTICPECADDLLTNYYG